MVLLAIALLSCYYCYYAKTRYYLSSLYVFLLYYICVLFIFYIINIRQCVASTPFGAPRWEPKVDTAPRGGTGEVATGVGSIGLHRSTDRSKTRRVSVYFG